MFCIVYSGSKKTYLFVHLFFRYILILLFALLVFPVSSLHAQPAKRILGATQTYGPIIIDGRLNEPAWDKAEKATGFVQTTPQPGEPSVQKTEVSILYDNNAIYIGAVLYDHSPDSILSQLSARDEYSNNNTDAFGVTFDTYLDNQNATQFVVTAAGVQTDAVVRFDGVDVSWNAAWFSKVTINEKGWWCVEMKIPYSAIRFPKKPVQTWGINFFRVIRRHRERSYWNTIVPGVPNVIGQSGVLTGIHDIISPLRLAFLPYLSSYVENYSGTTTKTLNGGLDLKYGINESFTLDATLIPDFGQTLFDNKVLNLSPVEVKYDERRYFFTEGVSLFNKNDLFYSRRVGGMPVAYNSLASELNRNEVVTENPTTTKLYNALKVSGRNKDNLGIGFFNAISAPASATVLDTTTHLTRKVRTSTLTNYNVIVLDQALKNNSYVSFINTSVVRKDSFYNADVSALLFKFANKSNTYGIDGSTDVSQLYYPGSVDIGHRYYLDVAKLSGNSTWALKTSSISDHFHPNDLGYLARNNITNYMFDYYYNMFKPRGMINTSYNHAGIGYYRVFNPDVFQRLDIYGSHNVTFKNFLTTGLYWDLQPAMTYDYYEPRTFGRYYLYPRNYMAGYFYSSDYRKKFALDVEFNNRWFSERKRNTFYWLIAPRYRFSDKFSMVYSISGINAINDVGFVANVNDSIFLGIRDVNTITNTLDAAYIFTSTMSLKVDARHYWSQANYSGYRFLSADGNLNPTSYNSSHNINYNTFNVYASFVWQFRPGSEISIVYQNSIYSSGNNILSNYIDDINYTFKSPQSNSLSVKIIYYLDYLEFRNALKIKN